MRNISKNNNGQVYQNKIFGNYAAEHASAKLNKIANFILKTAMNKNMTK